MIYQLGRKVRHTKNRIRTVAAGGFIAGIGGVTALFPLGASAAQPMTATANATYTAYSLQRHLDLRVRQFNQNNAHISMVGDYEFTLHIGSSAYTHAIHITNQSGNNFTGTGRTPATGTAQYHETISGTINQNTHNFTLHSHYNNSSYSYTLQGHVNQNGSLTVTSWSSSTGQTRGNWTTTGHASKQWTDVHGTGEVYYSDANGNWYDVNVMYVNIDEGANRAWFAGPVVSGNTGSGEWLFAEVRDGGTPNNVGDRVAGSFTTQNAAHMGVVNETNPADGPFAVTAGDVDVE